MNTFYYILWLYLEKQSSRGVLKDLNTGKCLEVLNSNKTPNTFSIYQLKFTKHVNFVRKPFLIRSNIVSVILPCGQSLLFASAGWRENKVVQYSHSAFIAHALLFCIWSLGQINIAEKRLRMRKYLKILWAI